MFGRMSARGEVRFAYAASLRMHCEHCSDEGVSWMPWTGAPVLVLDWRTEVRGDKLLAQMCHPLPEEQQQQQQQQQEGVVSEGDGPGLPGCSLDCVLEALEGEMQVGRCLGR